MITNLTIAVCTKDRFKSLENCIKHVHHAVMHAEVSAACEVIIIDDGPLSDDQKQMLKEACGEITLNYYRKSGVQQRGLYGSRRLAAQLTETSHILFIDDDCMLGPNYIRSIFNEFSHNHDIVGITGVDHKNLTVPHPALKALWKFFLLCNLANNNLSPTGFNNGHAFWKLEKEPFFCDFVHGCNMAFLTNAIRNIPECRWLTGHSIAEDLVLSIVASRSGKLLVMPGLDFLHLEVPGGRDYGIAKLWKKLKSHWHIGRMINDTPFFAPMFAWSATGLCLHAAIKTFLVKIGRRHPSKQ